MSRHGPPLSMPTSASGISLDPQSLERVIAGTRRKDGSIRKELKVRPGFTPEEDKARYKSTGARETSRLKGYVPGATSQSSATFGKQEAPGPGDFPALVTMTAAQKKNAKRRDKKKMEREAEDAKGWDSEEEDQVGTGEGAATGAGATREGKPEAIETAAQDPNADPKQALRHLIQQSVSSNPVAPPPRPVQSTSTTPSTPSSKANWRPAATPPAVVKEKKDPRPGGLFAAAFKGSTSREGLAGSDESDSALSRGMNRLEVGSRDDKQKSSSGEVKGGASSSSTPASAAAPVPSQPQTRKQNPTKSTSPGSAPSDNLNAVSNSKPGSKKPSPANKPSSTGSPVRQRSEVRVRPGGGLGGLMKQIAEQNGAK